MKHLCIEKVLLLSVGTCSFHKLQRNMHGTCHIVVRAVKVTPPPVPFTMRNWTARG